LGQVLVSADNAMSIEDLFRIEFGPLEVERGARPRQQDLLLGIQSDLRVIVG